MRLIPAIILIVALASGTVKPMGSPVVAQGVVIPLVPASAVIRGENIRLRVDPAEVTEVVAILQRGDAVTITGDPVAADGDEFIPVEATATGDSGWVRDLFIDPDSIVPLDALPELAPEPEPVPEIDVEIDVPEEPTRRERAEEDAAATEEEPQNQRNRRNRAERDAAEETQDEAGEVAAASVSGVGATTSQTFLLEPGRYRVVASMQVDDATGFIADLLGPDDVQENLFNETIEEPQAWTAETVVRIRTAGDYYVEVSDTELEWTIEITPA